MLLFVYGTLKKDYGNNRLLETSEFVGEGRTRESFLMLRAGFPVLMREPRTEVHDRYWLPAIGEVYRVNNPETWARLDRLEGIPDMYTREKTHVDFLTGETAEVQVYIGNPKLWWRRFSTKHVTDHLCACSTDGAYIYA